MPSVGLVLSNPQVSFADNEYGGREGWRLSFDADLAGGFLEKVELTTEEGDIRNLEGCVGFESTSKEAYKGFQKGSLTYWEGSKDEIFPSPPNYLVTLRMSDEDLSELARTISSGLPLRSVNLAFSFDDMQSGWAPDGSHKKWDNRTKPAVEVQGYRLFFGKPETEDEADPEAPQPGMDLDAKIHATLTEAARSLRYVLYALGALIVAVILR